MFSLPGHVLFWIVALVIFLVVEAVSAGLVSIWFAAGALAALICAALKGPLWLQAIWFVVVSGVTLILTRPLVKKYVNGKSVATNADRNIGRSAVVTEKVDNLAGVGTVKLDGVLWSARSVNDAPIEEGTTVVVREIRGVKLLVEPESGE